MVDQVLEQSALLDMFADHMPWVDSLADLCADPKAALALEDE